MSTTTRRVTIWGVRAVGDLASRERRDHYAACYGGRDHGGVDGTQGGGKATNIAIERANYPPECWPPQDGDVIEFAGTGIRWVGSTAETGEDTQ